MQTEREYRAVMARPRQGPCWRWPLWCALCCGLLAGPAWGGDLYGGASDLPAEVRSLLSATDPARRREGVERLEGLEPRLSTPYLMQRLRDGDATVRTRSAQALALAAAIDAAPLLLDCVSDVDPPVRVACADAVGQFGALPKELQTRAAATLARALGDTQYDVRAEVLRALGRMLRAQVLQKEDVASLLGPVLLRVEDENVGVRRAAAAVLGLLGTLAPSKEILARVSVALLGQLSDTARDVRTQALASLGELRTTAAGPAALRMLRDSTDEVRRQAVVCLGQLQYAPAIPTLVELMDAGSERVAAATALGQIAKGQLAEAPTQRAAAALAVKELLRALDREEVRALARDALIATGGVAIAALCSRLDQSGGQPEIGAVVDLLRDLAGSATPAQRPLIVKTLTAELWRSRIPREQVLEALAVLGDRSVAPLCAGLLSDHDVPVRRQAIMALRRPGMLDERAVDAVLAATRDSDREVRLLAIQALGEVGGRAAQDRLTEILLRASPELRAAAAVALGQSIAAKKGAALSETALQALLTAVSTAVAPNAGVLEKDRLDEAGEQRVRRAAASALAQALASNPAQQTQAATALIAQLRKGHGEAQSDVVTALGGVLRGHPSEPARDVLVSIAQLSADPTSKEAGEAVDALDALAAIRDPAAATKLLRLLNHRDPLRRARATAAVGTLLATAPTTVLVDALAAVISFDADPRVIAEAAWALGELGAPRGSSLTSRAIAAIRQALGRKGEGAAEAAVHANALAALFRLGAADLADAFWLTDTDVAVRANAALLVGALQARSAGMRARLRNLNVVDADHRVRSSAAAAERGTGPVPVATRTHWLGMYQVDYDRRPLANLRYRLTLPDGLIRVGITDYRGIARQELLPPGECDVETLTEGEAVR